jgi:hypothetical protein
LAHKGVWNQQAMFFGHCKKESGFQIIKWINWKGVKGEEEGWELGRDEKNMRDMCWWVCVDVCEWEDEIQSYQRFCVYFCANEKRKCRVISGSKKLR